MLTLRQAIEIALASNNLPTQVVEAFKQEIELPVYQSFMVPSLDMEPLEALSYTFGTASELSAFMQGTDATEGWIEPSFFETEIEANDYIEEAKESGFLNLEDMEDEDETEAAA